MNKIAELLNGIKPPKPEGATSLYTVSWFLTSDQFRSSQAYIGHLPTPQALHNKKIFASKEKAEALKKDIEAAFITLGYGIEGKCFITEDWYE